MFAFGLAAELVYTNVLECLDLAGVPVRAEHRRPEHPLVIVGGHCAFNPEPMADFVDAFVIGDGEEAVGEITEVVGAWKRSGRTAREGVLRELATIPGVYVPSMYEVEYDGPFIAEVRPRFPDVPERVDKRTVADLGEWPYPKNQLVPAHRGGARPPQRRGLPRLHARLPVLPGGDDHPARCASVPADQVRTMVQDGLRRTGYDEVALTSLSTADFSGIDGLVAGLVNEQQGCGNVGLSLPSLRVDAFTVGIASEIQKVAPHRAHVRARGRHVADPPGDQQAHHRRRPLRRGRGRVLAGLAAGEALLPHRRADRDGRGHARHRAPRARGREDRPQVHEEGERAPRRSAASCRRRTRRSSGSGRTASQELQRKVYLLRDDLKKSGAHAALARSRGHVRRGHRVSRGDRRIGRVIERVWRAGGTFQEWSERFELDRWLDAMAAEGLDPDWYVTRHRTDDEILPWDHIAAGLHRDFLWDDWQEALAAHGLPDCRWTPCYDCGVCTDYALEHVVASAVAARGRQPGHRPGPRLRCARPAISVPVELTAR